MWLKSSSVFPPLQHPGTQTDGYNTNNNNNIFIIIISNIDNSNNHNNDCNNKY